MIRANELGPELTANHGASVVVDYGVINDIPASLPGGDPMFLMKLISVRTFSTDVKTHAMLITSQNPLAYNAHTEERFHKPFTDVTDWTFEVGLNWLRYFHIPTGPIIKYAKLWQVQDGQTKVLHEYLYDDDYDPTKTSGEYFAHTYNGLNQKRTDGGPASSGELHLKIIFDSTMNQSSLAATFGKDSPFNQYSFTTVGWSATHHPLDTWGGRVDASANIADGIHTISIDANSADGSRIDSDGNLAQYSPGPDTRLSFMIARTPPTMTITNGRGEILDHGAYSDDGHINIHAQHNSAPLRDLEFFPEDASHPKVLATPGNPDMDFSTDFLADAAWHQVRACDTAGNCVYSTFGIFPPDSNPGNPPGAPPPPGGGGNQRPNPGPGQPMPPRDDPNAPPAPPHQHLALPPPPPPPEACAIPGGCCVGPSCWTPPPPPCRGLACYRGSFCSRYPRRCTMEDQLAHDPNAKYGPAGAVTPGQMMTYTVEFENEGDGLALGTFVKDLLDPALDDTTLALRDMRRVDFLNNTETPASFPWSYDARTRTVTVVTGDADSRKGGRIVLEARLKNDAAPGTIISNKAVVHFPNVLEVTPTNTVVSAVPLPVSLSYVGASSATYMTPVLLAARLSASGRPLAQQKVEFLLNGSTLTALTDITDLAAITSIMSVPPGDYRFTARYPGDAFYYLSGEKTFDFAVAKIPTRLQTPQASGRMGETARLALTLTLTDTQGQPLERQAEEPKTVFLDLLNANGQPSAPIASALLSGTSAFFQFALPMPPQLSWTLRARFDGDSRYQSILSTGSLTLIDESAPAVSVQSPSGGMYFASQNIPIAFSVHDDADPAPSASAVLIHEGGGSLSVTNGQQVPVSGLSEGSWSLNVTGYDWAGNAGTARGAVFQVIAGPPDVEPPALTLTPANGSVLPSSTTALAAAYLDMGVGVDLRSVRLNLDGVDVTTAAAVGISSATFTPTAALYQGTHTFTAEVADLAANVAHATATFFVDSIPPNTALLLDGLAVSATNLVLISTDSLGFAADDAGAGVAQTLYAVDGGAEIMFVSTFSLAVGTHSLAFHSRDNAGNLESPKSVFITARSTAATSASASVSLTFPSPAAFGVEQAIGGIVDVRGSVLAGGAASWTLEAARGAAAASSFTAIASGAGDLSGLIAAWNTTALSGYQTLRLRAADASGNAASATATVFVGAPVFTFAAGAKDSNVIVGKIKNPTGIAARSDGSIWVASTDEDELVLLTSSGVVLSEVIAKTGRGDDGRGFKNPQGLALDAAGNLYVADKGNDRIVKLSADGSQVLLQIAKLGNHGKPKPGSGPGELRQPQDVAVDANGDIYVADSGNHRVQVFDSSGTFLRRLGPGVLLSTSEVRGIALTAEGLWVSDNELERVFLFSRAGGLIKSIGASGSAVGEISRMRGLASDRLGALYVVEPNRDRAQKFDPQGKGLFAFGSKAGLSHADKRAKRYLTQPIDAAIAPDGSVWITDAGRDRIVRYALPAGGRGAGRDGEIASSRTIERARRRVDHRDGARVERDDGAGVHVPKGALADDLDITVDKGDENQDREAKLAKRRERRVQPASEEVQYGPEGTTFKTPVTLTLPYDANLIAAQDLNEDRLQVHYWNPTLKDWEAMPSTVDKQNKTVSAQTSHFSLYQAMGTGGSGIGVAAAADTTFGLKAAYAFPNPVRGVSAVTIRIQPGLADGVEVRVYDLSGRRVHSSSAFTLNQTDDGNGLGTQYTYDHAWDVSGVGSGVYTYVITAKKAGQADIHKTGKVGVIR